MTITSSADAPLFVVVGATGTQGRSIIDAISADSKEYRVRGITRDPSKSNAQDLAKLGVEVVPGDVDDATSIEKAFQGAEVAFAMTVTDYWSPDGEEKEFKQGKLFADMAKKVGAKTFIWSGLTDQNELSHGKHPVWSFDVKAQVTRYARSLGGLRVVDVQPSSFASNYWSHSSPRPASGQTYILPLASAADTQIPICDIAADYGKYAIGALNAGVDTVYAASEYITPVQLAEQYSMVTGHTINFVEVPDDQMYAALKGAGEKFATTLVAMYAAMREVGYYGGADLAPSQKVLPSPARTFVQSLEANKAEVDKIFQE
ncbi:NAD(P)-binding protein [Cystobasidium minutum MCA 4210]|uniref:NAD(P)-binding protein n=1 Tax=Cystobasidium minutum MCA 4210 TaxID=1397322 RepID=UPI0034CD35B6|eukprot:jgi/Rhomi1/173384/fgenesh1_kg.6_\